MRQGQGTAMRIATLLKAALVATALAQPAVAQPAKVLRVVPHADLTVLDPVWQSVVISRLHGAMIYEELFAWDSKLQPKPQMVDTWSVSPDKLTWSFTLRPGLRFHDGSPVTTTDVVASLKRWMMRDVIGAKLATYGVTLTPTDANSFTLALQKPFPMMLFALGSAVVQIPVIMRARDIEDPAARVNTAIGSGPFRYVAAERLAGALTVYERNPDYVPRAEPADGMAGGRVVKVDRIEWKVIPDASTAAAALQAGEVDIWEQPSLDLLPKLATNPNIRLQRLTELSNQGALRANALHPPFNDIRARQALNYIVDQGDVMAAAFGDEKYWRRCNATYVCGGPYGTEAGAEGFHQDFAKARQLLADSGYKGEKLVFVATKEIGTLAQMAEVVSDAMKRAGLNVDVVWGDWGTTVSRLSQTKPPAEGGWNFFLTTASGPTMHHPLTNLYGTTTCSGAGAVGRPCDELAEKLRQDFLDADDASRPAALERLHRRFAEVVPYRVLGQYDQPIAMRSNVSGVLESPLLVYWNIEKK